MKGNIFKQVMVNKVSSSKFDLSHDLKCTFSMGELVPTMVLETMPGDYFEIKPETLLRFAPLVSPVMHEIRVNTHVFFVPNRIQWTGWEDFITGEVDGDLPYFNLAASSISVGDLGDYLGLGLGMPSHGTQWNALIPAGYLKIYDEYYRDENLVAEKWQAVTAGNNSWIDTFVNGKLLLRAWNHDYFTSCLPWPQKGDEVTLPLLNNDTADVTYKAGGGANQLVREAVDGSLEPDAGAMGSGTPAAGLEDTISSVSLHLDLNATHEVDINAEASTITTLRRAFKLQEFLEKDARGGTRYVENIYNHFGVIIEDYRIQRPEYIGGTAANMVISEVLSTAETEGTANIPVGYMAGHGISLAGGNKIKYACKEHGFIYAITSVRPRTAYTNQISKMWRRETRLDFPFPEFAHIGEQEVYNWELYPTEAVLADFEGIFGYIPRYAEMKFHNSRTAGLMRTTLEYWHLGRDFSTAPALNAAFVECLPDSRIFVDTVGAQIYAHIINNVWVSRKLPKFGNPKL